MKFLLPIFTLHLLFLTSASARNYRHTPKELIHTNQLVIKQSDCKRNETPIFVHTAAVTSGKYFERRMTIRRTWGREAKNASLKVIFVIGLPKNLTLEKTLKAEADRFGDILQFNFVEDYYNLTLKAIAELKWAWRHCNRSRYLMKVDDDVLVNVPLLTAWIKERKIPSGITGRVMTTPANRQPGHKWYMPEEYYDKNSYKFLSGFSYLLSMNRLKKLLDSIKKYKGPVLDIDDLWLTGIIIDHSRIKRFNNHRFRYYCGLDQCTMQTSLVLHACPTSRDTAIMYDVWKSSSIAPWWCFDDPLSTARSSWSPFSSFSGPEFRPSDSGSPTVGGNRSRAIDTAESQLFSFNLGDLRFVIQNR